MSTTSIPRGARCAIYARESDDAQSSLPTQKRLGLDRAEVEGLRVMAYVDDDGRSGDDLARPGLSRLADIFQAAHRQKEPIVCLIVDQADRLSRADSMDTGERLAPLRRLGLRWIMTGLHTYDLRDPLGLTLLNMEADFKSHPFLKEHARRVLNGVIDAARLRFWSGAVPLGYRIDEASRKEHPAGKRRTSGRLVIDLDTAPLVVELFERYVRGESTVDLARWLTVRTRPPRALTWSSQAVQRILRSRLYTGVRLMGKEPRGKHVRVEDGKATLITEDNLEPDPERALICIPGVAPRLISDELWQAAQDRLARGKRNSHHANHAAAPLAGLGRCGHCGGTLHVAAAVHGKARRKALRIYCSTRRVHGVAHCAAGASVCSHDRVLTLVLQALADNLLADDAVERLAKLAREGNDRARQQAEAARSHLARQLAENARHVEQARRRLGTAPEDLVEDYQAAIRDLKAQRTDLETQMQALEREQRSATLPAGEDTLRRWLDACRTLCQPGGKVRTDPEQMDGTANELLHELIEGFRAYWREGRNGKRELDRVEVDLPGWLGVLLATGASTHCERCIILSAVA